MKKILLTLVITFIFIVYLFQHRDSLRRTQDIAKLERTRQLLSEEIFALHSEETKIFLFTNFLDTAEKLNLVFPKRSRSVGKILPVAKTAPNSVTSDCNPPVTKPNNRRLSISPDANSHE